MNNDFRYVMQDMTNVYIGAKYTYDEIMNVDEVPFKLKVILSHYMLKEVAGNTTLENHIFYMKPDDMSYMVYKRMKARFKLNVFKEDGHGKGKPGYIQKEYKIQDIVEGPEAAMLHEKMNQIFVEEMHITKLGLLSVSI
ncbi:MAG: hypothetical protein KIG50_06285 [Lachnospiraceae bacterium]|nr:hypothetical protein [Lachnospiraceae bacterium]